MSFGQLYTRMHETAKKISSAMDYVHKSEIELHESVINVCVRSQKMCAKVGGVCLVPDVVCVSMTQTSEGVDRAEAAVLIEL